MQNYLDLTYQAMVRGSRQKNRTGIDTFMLPGGMLQFDLANGFPIITTKKINFKAVVAELIGFIRGYTSAADFRALGTKIWDENANHPVKAKDWLANPNRKGEDDLGRIYGAQWGTWFAPGGKYIDQVRNAIETLLTNHTSRRNIVTAWNPGELDQMALPPCHLLWQLLVTQEDSRLHMTMYMRSCDMFLGVPFNISSYALLLSIIAHITGYRVGTLTMFLADVHVYENHIGQVKTQTERKPKKLPDLDLWDIPNPAETGAWDVDKTMQVLQLIYPNDIKLLGYFPYPAIKGEMA